MNAYPKPVNRRQREYHVLRAVTHHLSHQGDPSKPATRLIQPGQRCTRSDQQPQLLTCRGYHTSRKPGGILNETVKVLGGAVVGME
jgi:hypothetical protein